MTTNLLLFRFAHASAAVDDDDDTSRGSSRGEKQMIRLGYFATMVDEANTIDIQNTLDGQAQGIVGARRVELVPHELPAGVTTKKYVPSSSWFQDQDLDAVLVTADTMLVDTVALGNELAAYAATGKCVILAFFATNRWGVAGDWKDKQYNCVAGATVMNSKELKLGMVHEPQHAIMDGVTTFTGSMKATYLDVVNGCTTVAQYTDGTPLVVASSSSSSNDNNRPARHVVLNYFPVSSITAPADFYKAETDGGRLLYNAISWCVEGNTITRTNATTTDEL